MKRPVAVFGLALAMAALGAIALVAVTSATATQPPKEPHKVYVCKYVGKPGVDERLQTGQNPIETDYHSLPGFPGYPGGTFPFAFADAQGNSVAIGWVGEGFPVLDITDCPTPPAPAKGALIVNKVVVNDNGGTKTADDFSFTLDGTPYAFEADASNKLVLDPGTYVVAEVAAEGYSSQGGGTVDVEAGETTTVTITNNDIPPHVLVGDASVSCILPDGYYRVGGTVDGQAADEVRPATIAGDFAGTTEVTVTRGDTSVRKTVTTDGTCSTAKPPVVAPPEVVPPAVTPPAVTPPAEPEAKPEPKPAPLTPPTKKTTKKTTETAPAQERPAPLPPKQAVAGAYAKSGTTLAHTP